MVSKQEVWDYFVFDKGAEAYAKGLSKSAIELGVREKMMKDFPREIWLSEKLIEIIADRISSGRVDRSNPDHHFEVEKKKKSVDRPRVGVPGIGWYVAPYRFRTKHLHLILGESGAGKSTFVRMSAARISRGEELVPGEHYCERSKVLIVTAETPAKEYEQRINDDFGSPGEEIKIVQFDPRTESLTGSGWERFENLVTQFEPSIVFLDPFDKLHGLEGREADKEGYANQPLKFLERLANEFDLAVVYTMRTNKRGEIMGSKTFYDTPCGVHMIKLERSAKTKRDLISIPRIIELDRVRFRATHEPWLSTRVWEPEINGFVFRDPSLKYRQERNRGAVEIIESFAEQGWVRPRDIYRAGLAEGVGARSIKRMAAKLKKAGRLQKKKPAGLMLWRVT